MGNSKSKKSQKEPDRFFEREKWKQRRREEKRSKPVNSGKKRVGRVTPPDGSGGAGAATLPPPPAPRPAPSPHRPYDEEALERMRHQLHNDSDAFLLNNILLSVQFFENYEKEMQHVKNNPTPEWDSQVNTSLVQHNKHAFLSDKLLESVHEHVRYRRAGGVLEPLSAQRMFVIYDNIEASEPGDTSDYSAVLDAPFYKMLIEDTKEPGYIKLRKIEVLQNMCNDNIDNNTTENNAQSDFTDSEKESIASDESPYPNKSHGEALLMKLKMKLENGAISNTQPKLLHQKIINTERQDVAPTDVGRRPSGPIRQISSVAAKATLSNISRIKECNEPLRENKEPEKRKLSGITKAEIENFNAQQELLNNELKPRKSILKTSNTRRASGPTRELRSISRYAGGKSSEANSISEETETSGYRSNSTSSPQNESSGTDSDYGYSTIGELTTPKPLALSSRVNLAGSSGIVPDECWTPVQVMVTSHWSDDDDDEDDEARSDSAYKTLYETHYYMNSTRFMGQFVDTFMTNIGKSLEFSSDAIDNALTQGASIYCDTVKNNSTVGYEIVPAVIAAWPNSANEWIIRQRRIIQNPRTNFSYQWPTKYMVNKARGLGCLLVPVGYRPKRGSNPDQQLQWRLVFPAAERYLESCLAHSQVRCYLFTLALVKTFMENGDSKIGIDASHIKNHLFWECEDNYARWPEDRLGETLRIFLRSLYRHFGQARFPNYFIESCDNFKSIPRTILLKLQRRLADILETPVMHVLCAIRNLKYTKKSFYPQFDYMRLYRILTTKNVLRLINPNIQGVNYSQGESGDSESEDEYKDAKIGFWDKAKSKDKQYQWKKEQQRQAQARRKAAVSAKARKSVVSSAQFIDKSIALPAKMDVERRRLVLEFFISHFIEMALHSDKCGATKQAIIYLEQAQRLSTLLREEPGGEESAAELLDTIRAKLTECKVKLVSQNGPKLAKRKESVLLHNFSRTRPPPAHRLRADYINLHSQDSPPPPPSPGTHPFTFADLHADHTSSVARTQSFRLEREEESEEESKL